MNGSWLLPSNTVIYNYRQSWQLKLLCTFCAFTGSLHPSMLSVVASAWEGSHPHWEGGGGTFSWILSGCTGDSFRAGCRSWKHWKEKKSRNRFGSGFLLRMKLGLILCQRNREHTSSLWVGSRHIPADLGKSQHKCVQLWLFFFFFEALNCSQIWLLFCVGVNKHMTETFSAKLKPSSDMPKCHGFLAKYLRFFVWFGLDIVKKFSLDF